MDLVETAITPSLVDAPDSARAYERLKRMIVTGEIAPNTPLSEGMLVSLTGIGRTPVRDALRQLASERLVVIFPRKGIVVAGLSLLEVRQLFEARLALEGESAAWAAERATSDDVRRLEDLNTALSIAQANGAFSLFLSADQKLHREIILIGRNVYLEEAADRVLTLNEWVWHIHMNTYGSGDDTFAAHDEILQAISRGNPSQAREAMVAHIERAKSKLMFPE